MNTVNWSWVVVQEFHLSKSKKYDTVKILGVFKYLKKLTQVNVFEYPPLSTDK